VEVDVVAGVLVVVEVVVVVVGVLVVVEVVAVVGVLVVVEVAGVVGALATAAVLWQAWRTASWLTVLTPWLRSLLSVPLTVGGRS
jgi:hypothetical protein